MTSRGLLYGLLLGNAFLLACGEKTATPADGGTDAHAKGADADADAVSEDGGADGGCITPDEDAGICTLCESRWYCYGSPPYRVCPNDGGGTCTAGDEPCFACRENVEGYVCYCSSDGGDGGGEPDAGTMWQCQSNETGCGT